VFLVAGLGGGTGTGAIQVVSRDRHVRLMLLPLAA